MRRVWHLNNYAYIFYRSTVEKILCGHNLGNVLDAGCGSEGSISFLLEQIVGVDVSRRNISQIHKTKQGDFLVASLTYLPFKQEVFDTVICADVLEHLKEKRLVLEEIARAMHANARLIGSTSNLLNPLMLLDSSCSILSKLLAKYVGQNYERNSRLTPRALLKLFRDAGFEVRLSIYGFPPFQPWLYEFSNRKLPWFAHVWIIFDRLTKKKPLNQLKETIVFEAVK
jgi:2-polyprenyl-3-methyl-5-hydroxy-6-metoxy-1,4-benzoquinol methylase